MKELEQAMQKVFTEMVSSGDLTKIIEENVQAAVGGVLHECFRDYSPFRKALVEHINQNLSVDFSALGFAGYNNTLLKIIKTKLDASVYRAAEVEFSKSLDELLQAPPVEITLEKLLEQFADYCKSRADEYAEPFHGISWHLEYSDVGSRGWGSLKLDMKPRTSARDCKYDIAFTNEGEIYRLGFPYSGDVTKKMFAGPFFDFERSLFQMYAAKTKLILPPREEAA